MSDCPYKVGSVVLIRTVTYSTCGRITAVFPNELVLEDASWVADTGRFSESVSKGEFAEVEPILTGPVVVGRGAIVDVVLTPAKLPLKIK